MKLSEKGPIVAPPVLSGWAESVSLNVQGWARIVSATHWQFGNPTKVDGADFYVEEEELGHIHLDGEVHLPLTRALHDAIVAAQLAERFRWAANWVQFRIEDEESSKHSVWLFQLAYDRIQGVTEANLLDRIAAAKSASGRSAALAA
jgi:Family of unknown function (DUF5519)